MNFVSSSNVVGRATELGRAICNGCAVAAALLQLVDTKVEAAWHGLAEHQSVFP